MIKKISAVIFFLFAVIPISHAIVDVGTELQIKNAYYNNLTDYDDAKDDKQSYTFQRTRFYIQGEIQKGVIGRLQLQSIGMWGGENSTSTVIIENYKYQNFTPWLEHAYIQLQDIFKSKFIGPVGLTIGKQPLKYGDGIVVDDDNHGLFAYKLNSNLPLKTNMEFFNAKVYDSMEQKLKNNDFSVSGLYLKWIAKKNITPQIYYVKETDKSHQLVIDGNSNKNFYGLRIDGVTSENVDYKLEYIKQGGELKRDNNLNNINYKASAYVAGVGMTSLSSKIGPTRITIENAQGSGDKSKSETEQYLTARGFTPYLTNKSKDFGETYYGEIFSQILPGLSNKSIILVGLDANPVNKAHIGVNYLRFTRIAPNGLYGEEIDMFLYTTHKESTTFRFVYAILRPGKAFMENGSNLNHIGIEFLYKF
jgi:hypothetical protein